MFVIICPQFGKQLYVRERVSKSTVKDHGATLAKVVAFCENCFCHNLKTNKVYKSIHF